MARSAVTLVLGLLGAVALVVVHAQEPPALSEVETLQLEVVSLKQQLALATAQRDVCVGQQAPAAYRATSDALQADIATLVAAFEAAHPGWTLDAATRRVTPTKGGD